MNRILAEAAVKTWHGDTLQSLKDHVPAFVTAYDFAKLLKPSRRRTPFEVIGDAWTNDPPIFEINPNHLIPGSYTWAQDSLSLQLRF